MKPQSKTQPKQQPVVVDSGIKKAFQDFMSGKAFTSAWRTWKNSKERHITGAMKQPLIAAFEKLAGVDGWKALLKVRTTSRKAAKAQKGSAKESRKAA